MTVPFCLIALVFDLSECIEAASGDSTSTCGTPPLEQGVLKFECLPNGPQLGT